MDDIASTIALKDVEFFCTEIEQIGASKGCFVNPTKTRILTSCNGTSILPSLNDQLATSISNTISKYSIKENKDGTISPVELTSGF
jgi:hypothetical protein